MKYRIPEPGTTISSFADNNKKKKKLFLIGRFLKKIIPLKPLGQMNRNLV
jgi:hypothetical protein